MGKNEIYWAIFRGGVLMPFTIRTTRKQCVGDFVRDYRAYLSRDETCRKVVINEWKKP